MKFTIKIRSKILLDTYHNYIHKDSKVLDVGCGNGYMSELINDKIGCKITGTDTINYLEWNMPFKLIKGDTDIPFTDNTFDVAMLNDVIHHIPYEKQVKILKECKRVAKTTLIFDQHPSLKSKIACYCLNKIHNPNIKITQSFRDTISWEDIFQQNNIQYLRLNIKKKIWYPLSHLAYKLSRGK